MKHFPITLIGDDGHKDAQSRTVVRLTRRCPQCLSRIDTRNAGYRDGTCSWCRGEGDYFD